MVALKILCFESQTFYIQNKHFYSHSIGKGGLEVVFLPKYF